MGEPAAVGMAVDSGVVGVLLSGGSSRRMGRPKALVAVDGVSMVERVGVALAAAGCRPILVVGVPPGVDPDEWSSMVESRGWSVVADRWPGEGPLGGLLTAFAHLSGAASDGRERSAASSGSDVLVAACDLPDLDLDTVELMLRPRPATVDAVVAVTDRLEPMLSRWSPAARTFVADRFAAGERSLVRVLASLHVEGRPVRPEALRNVNTPEDLER